MKLSEFRSFIEQMKLTSVPRRLLFIWQGKIRELENLLVGLEIHRINLASLNTQEQDDSPKISKLLEDRIVNELKEYESSRNEPSVLVIENALLLARYSCDITAFFKFGISPRSAVILVFPEKSDRRLPIKAERWVKNEAASLLMRVAKQIGDAQSIIEESGE